MKKLFGLFVIGILSSTAMAELVCLSPSGCVIELETGACPTCVETSIVESIVETSIVEPIVESIIKSEIVSTSKSKCPNYFEKDHGGKTCEIQWNKCDSNKFPTLCDINFKGCKEIEINYNIRFERNNGKLTCG